MQKNKQIPCKECLKFPICRYRKEVKCIDLVAYINIDNMNKVEHLFRDTVIGVSMIRGVVTFAGSGLPHFKQTIKEEKDFE